MTKIIVMMMVGCAMAGLLSSSTSVSARENKTYIQGMIACMDWCDAHNREPKSRGVCYGRCDAYWIKNGSDTGRTVN